MISIALPSPLMACVAGALIAAAALVAAAALAHRRTRAKIRSLSDAFDHMSQGLCMFDAAGRIIVCNQPYLRMYRLSPEVVKPGCTLRALIEHRRQTGLFTGDPAQYCKDIMEGIAAGTTSRWTVNASDGRIVHAINVPTPDGGWVSTHEDVTEQRRLQEQRDDMVAQQKRRSVVDAAIATFRSGMEALLMSFGDSAAAMKSTAVSLSTAANHSAQSATSAVAASNDASNGVRVAADATDELANSIAEIARQITQTTDVVRLAVDEAHSADGEMTTLADSAQRIGDIVKPFRALLSRPICSPSMQRSRRRAPATPAADLRWSRQGHRSDRRTDLRRAGLDRKRRRFDPAHYPAHARNPALHLGRRRLGRTAECCYR
jgi:methyl-accepting chemotaxis protein